MADFYDCFACHEVTPMTTEEKACPLCGSINGQVITAERLKEGIDAGAYFSRDAEVRDITLPMVRLPNANGSRACLEGERQSLATGGADHQL